MAQKKSKHIRNETTKQHHEKSYKKIAFLMVLILFVIIIIKIILNKPIEKKYEITQIVLDNENITEKLSENIIIQNEKIYMSYEDIHKYLDKQIYQEEETGLIITSSNKKVAAIKKDDDKITINGANQKIDDVLIEQDNKEYIAVSEMENVYDYDLEYNVDSNIVTIDSLNKELVKAYSKKNINIKEKNEIFSKNIEKVEKGNWIIYISEENGIAKIRTQSGKIGYVKKKMLDNFVTERENFEEKNTEDINIENAIEFDITQKDITDYQKRLEVINLILQEAIKNDKMQVKVTSDQEESQDLERFKIEAIPMLRECGIKMII